MTTSTGEFELPQMKEEDINEHSNEGVDVESIIDQDPVLTPPAVVVAEIKEEVKEESIAEPGYITTIKNSLEEYYEAMKPGKIIIEKRGIMHQRNLWQTIEFVLMSDQVKDFKLAWKTILDFANLHRQDVFGDRYLYRFANEWKWGMDTYTIFSRILNLIINTCDESKMDTWFKDVDFFKTLNGMVNENIVIDEDIKQKLSAYYGK